MSSAPGARRFSHASRERLTYHDLGRFPGDMLFDRVARAVCHAGCLPRRELYEAWEVARRTRRRFRGGRVVDVAAGHALLAHLMLLLDDSSPRAIAVDRTWPASRRGLHDALTEGWPRLRGRVEFLTADLHDTPVEPGDVVVASHACGALTDAILDRVAAVRARVAVLPCCHDLASDGARALGGWMDGALAIDAARALRLEAAGYRVWTQTIAPGITSKSRLLLGEPDAGAARHQAAPPR
jgi:hypothetical protein